MKKTTHYLSERQYQRLRELAQDTGLKVSELIRRAIDVFLDRGKTDDGNSIYGRDNSGDNFG